MSGHGHVTPNPDGSKARCGGPGICVECNRELADLWSAGEIMAKDKTPGAAPVFAKPIKPSFTVLSLTRSEVVAVMQLAHIDGQSYAGNEVEVSAARQWADAQLDRMEKLGTYEPQPEPQPEPLKTRACMHCLHPIEKGSAFVTSEDGRTYHLGCFKHPSLSP